MTGLAAANGGNSTTVYQMSIGLLGPVGGVLAMIGVIACPITSGDTAFRSARLTIADWFKIDQKDPKKRLALSFPLLLVGYFISFLDYNVVWRYFSWSNQTLAMIALWAGAAYPAKFLSKNASFIAAVPATFMSAVSCTYIMMAGEGLGLSAYYQLSCRYCICSCHAWYLPVQMHLFEIRYKNSLSKSYSITTVLFLYFVQLRIAKVKRGQRFQRFSTYTSRPRR